MEEVVIMDSADLEEWEEEEAEECSLILAIYSGVEEWEDSVEWEEEEEVVEVELI